MKKWDVLTLDFLWIMTAATKIAAMTITRTTERTQIAAPLVESKKISEYKFFLNDALSSLSDWSKVST